MQGDLFHIPVHATSFNPSQTSFLERFRVSLRMDHLIVLLIIQVVIFVIVFSAGVEKGKRSLAVSSIPQSVQAAADVPVLPQPIAVTESKPAIEAVMPLPVAAEVQPAIKVKQPIPDSDISITEISDQKLKAITPERLDGKYTIQLVTYKSDSQAQKQIEFLEVKGYRGFVVPSGDYYQVCINAFESKQSALSQLQNLQLQKLAPNDAYVRSMPHQ